MWWIEKVASAAWAAGVCSSTAWEATSNQAAANDTQATWNASTWQSADTAATHAAAGQQSEPWQQTVYAPVVDDHHPVASTSMWWWVNRPEQDSATPALQCRWPYSSTPDLRRDRVQVP